MAAIEEDTKNMIVAVVEIAVMAIMEITIKVLPGQTMSICHCSILCEPE